MYSINISNAFAVPGSAGSPNPSGSSRNNSRVVSASFRQYRIRAVTPLSASASSPLFGRVRLTSLRLSSFDPLRLGGRPRRRAGGAGGRLVSVVSDDSGSSMLFVSPCDNSHALCNLLFSHSVQLLRGTTRPVSLKPFRD